MLIVRGTKKFRDRVAGTPIGANDVATTALGDWFATVLFWRPQVVMLVNERTFVPVLLPFAPAATLLTRIPDAIVSVLRGHGVNDSFIATEAAAMTEQRLGPTNNRSVLGVLNQFSHFGEYGWKEGMRDLDELSLELAEIPVGPLYGRHGMPDLELGAITGTPNRKLVAVTYEPGPHLRVVEESGRAKERAKEGKARAQPIYQLKVTLLDIKPPVWRRVLVPADITLDKLHEVIQAAFGWWNYHLHEFDMGHVRYGVPDPDDWEPPKDERRAKLESVAGEGSRFRYTYDFGDDWRHEVKVEKVLSGDPALDLPACVDGRRAGPPEDCGGPWGYAELLKILADPEHPEHAERLAWIGGKFDPEAFETGDLVEQIKLGRLTLVDP